MKRSRNMVLAAVLAGGASLASAQIGPYGRAGLDWPPPTTVNPYGTGMPSATGLGFTAQSLFSPNPSVVSSRRSLGDATPRPLGSFGSSIGSGPAALSPLIPGEVGAMASAPSSTTHYPVANCYAGGCFGADGTQYTRGAGDVLFGSNGKMCQRTAPSALLVCN